MAKNIVLGKIYIDISGEIEAINHKTREKAVIKFYTRGWSTMSYLTGQIFDVNGEERYKIKGSWADKIFMVDTQTNEETLIFEENPSYPGSECMFGFQQIAVNLNYISDEMREVLPPSDTRLRGD